VDEKSAKKNGDGAPHAKARVESGVTNEAVPHQSDGESDCSEDEDTQSFAARFTRTDGVPRSHYSGGTGAAKTVTPSLLPSDYLVELDLHRLPPFQSRGW